LSKTIVYVIDTIPAEFRQSLQSIRRRVRARTQVHAHHARAHVRMSSDTFTRSDPPLSPDFCYVRITALVYGTADIWHRPERGRESVSILRRSLSQRAAHV